MNYSAINIQGNIISSEILEKIRTEDIRFQKPENFGLRNSASVRDEINLAWSLALSNWNAFKSKRENLNDSESGTGETRRYWMLPLLQIMGYELTISNAEIINGKSYAISHRATNKDGFPIHIVGVNQSLDKRAESGGTRLSPHALVQEYLNNNEHMYALVSNGRFIRILRDATRLSRLSYLEFDLEQIMEEGLYVEFALMFRVLHASRMPEKQDSGAECFLEFYHQEALASGSRIRERLSLAVENSIKELANGLLRNPNNQELRNKVLNQDLTAKEYYLFTLRLVYRILFLLVIEERKLIYSDKRDEELNRNRSIYYDFYSVQRLTKLAEKLIYVDPRKTDLWQSLITTFALFEQEQYGKKLGISPLGAGIFSPNALGIISNQLIDNETLLRVLRYLVTFENEQGQRVRVNYADLDVEEFGSVYEGLLDYDPQIIDNSGEPIFGFVKGDDRSSSGSHYTPEELVRPLIKHSLDYLIEDKLKEVDPEKGLLSLTICDVACGSGHILLSAARRVGFELAKVRSKEDQPTPSVLRVAVRDVIRHCIYGVDLNPLAVELCKVALWLEAHEPGEPLNFLDHHIKCGNAIVGLAHADELEKGIASEAFKTLPGDDKEIASAFKKRNDLELKTSGQLTFSDESKIDNELRDVQVDFLKFAQLPENTPEQIANKEKAYQELTTGKKWWRLKNLADLQVAQFFIPKTIANKEKLTTHSQYNTYLKQGTQIFDRGASMAISQEKRFFHWFLEFPEVFQKGGFDCILGNPPYLGGTKISTFYGKSLFQYLTHIYFPAAGRCDLIGYFIRQINSITKEKGFYSLITTNSVSEGDTREGALDIIVKHSSINHSVKSLLWPGTANVIVTLLTIFKGKWTKSYFLDNKLIDKPINAFLTGDEINGLPLELEQNKGIAYMGASLTGDGFIIPENFKTDLLNNSVKYEEVIFPYLNGAVLNNSPDQKTNISCLNFKDLEESSCRNLYPEAYDHLYKTVRLERMGKSAEVQQAPWWQYWRSRKELYDKLENCDHAIVQTRASKVHAFMRVDKKQVFSDALVVVASNSKELYVILNSTLHSEWAWQYSSKLKSDRRYSISDAFNTFPFPGDLKGLSEHDSKLYSARNYAFTNLNIGITKISHHISDSRCTIEAIVNLRKIQSQLDEAVLEAYGWQQDDPKWGKAIQLRHDFYEVDYLPENDRVRYTIHPDARKEVLKRLLQLNHERYAEEVAAGLHDKKGNDKKGKDTKPKDKNTKNDLEDYDGRIQPVLFPEADLFNQETEDVKDEEPKIVQIGSVVWLKASDGKELKIACGKNIAGAQFMNAESGFVKALLGKEEGDQVKFGNGFVVVKIE